MSVEERVADKSLTRIRPENVVAGEDNPRQFGDFLSSVPKRKLYNFIVPLFKKMGPPSRRTCGRPDNMLIV